MPNAETLARRALTGLSRRPWAVALLTLSLALPALLLHLGWQPLIGDEPIRALVALEIHYSNRFFAPTLQGLPYYNKPPLFNWLLVALFRLTGRQDEWLTRLPTIAALLLYCGALWRVLRPQLGSGRAYLVALAFATTGRVLFYDSFLGLIDLWHALLTWLGFMAVWHLGQQGRWRALFTLTYGLTALGFLLKGVPSLVFQALTLGVYAYQTRRWRWLLSSAHALGLAVLLGVLGTYFFFYSQYNSVEVALQVLWSQSSQRTVAAHALAESVRYVLLFPFDFIKHFLPWSLLGLALLVRPARQAVWAHPFLRYNALLFLAVVPVYWLSPSTIPRYLFMLVPLGLTVAVAAYGQLPAGAGLRRGLEGGLLVVLVLGSLAVWGGPLASPSRDAPHAWGWAAGLSAALALGTWLFARLPEFRLPVLGFYLLTLRLAFDAFVIPARLHLEPTVGIREAGFRVARETRGRPLWLLPGLAFNHDATYYITRGRGQPLTYGPPARGAYYVVAENQPALPPFRTLLCFELDEGQQFRVVEFK